MGNIKNTIVLISAFFLILILPETLVGIFDLSNANNIQQIIQVDVAVFMLITYVSLKNKSEIKALKVIDSLRKNMKL